MKSKLTAYLANFRTLFCINFEKTRLSLESVDYCQQMTNCVYVVSDLVILEHDLAALEPDCGVLVSKIKTF